MAKTFNEVCGLVKRIPSMELTTHFFYSVMCASLVPEDREKLVEELIDRVSEETRKENSEE